MPTPDILASSIMDNVAVLMNDAAKQEWTYAAQLPYLGIALQDLKKELQLNNSPVTNVTTSAPIEIDAGVASIGFGGVDPKLPDDLIEIQQVWERARGTDPWIPMQRVEYLPHYLEDVEINQFIIWAWEDNAIKLIPANAANDLKLDYIKDLFAGDLDENTNIQVINSDSYLQYHTAALLAKFVDENDSRAETLEAEAKDALEKMLGIDNKGRQQIYTRRRPFRAAWKNRGWW